jgi:CheY-like chemotaxis protein
VAEVVTAGVQVEVRTPPATSVLTRTLSATNAVTTPSLRRGENDDQALVRRGFRHMVDAAGDMEVLGEAADGAEAVALTRQLQPDVVLMDIRMRVLDGIVARRIFALEQTVDDRHWRGRTLELAGPMPAVSPIAMRHHIPRQR